VDHTPPSVRFLRAFPDTTKLVLRIDFLNAVRGACASLFAGPPGLTGVVIVVVATELASHLPTEWMCIPGLPATGTASKREWFVTSECKVSVVSANTRP
jgi:hypothetical protein